MQIAGILSGASNIPQAVHVYRITMPLGYINKHTKHKAYWVSAQNCATDLTEVQFNTLLSSDIIVLGRMITNDVRGTHELLTLLASRGATLVYETDDDLTEEYRDISNGKQQDCIAFIKHPYVSAVTVSTPHLARQITKHNTGQPVFVRPNCIETSYWEAVSGKHEREHSGTFNIMLTGSPTHGDDWIPAYHGILRILDEHPEARLLVGGYQPEYVDDERIIPLPFVPYYKYPTMLCEADVVVAAIDPNDPFNYSKSAVKAMEAWAAKRKLGSGGYGGAAVIATKSEVYHGTVKHAKNGLLSDHTEGAYYSNLKTLIDNPSLMERLQRRGRHDVIQKHSIHTQYTDWLSVYNKIRRLQ